MPHALISPRRGSVKSQRKPPADPGPSPLRYQNGRPSTDPAADSRLQTTPTKPQKLLRNIDSPAQTPDRPFLEDTTPLPPFPQLWDPAIDNLMARTSRAYKVVINYERDSYGGYRWCPEDIAQICIMGEYLDDDIRGLYQWHHVVAERGQDNRTMMRRVAEDAERLRELCEGIQSLISATERKLPTELMRDANYVLDEDDIMDQGMPREDTKGAR